MLETFEAEGGGALATVESKNSSAAGSPKEEEAGGGGGGVLEEDSTPGRLELARIWVALYWRKVAPMGAMIWIGSNAGKCSKSKCNKILWIKTGKKRAWAEEILLWTSTKERMKNEENS